jgi:hypothetical protein
MSDDNLPSLSRQDRLAARKRRFRWAGVLVAALVVGAAGVLAAFTSTDDAPAAPGGAAAIDGAGRSSTASSTTISTPATVPVRPLSHVDPLRLWVGGDSLSGALGPELGAILGASGVVETHVDYKVSSGLVPGVRDWQSYAEKTMATEDFEAVVFMIGTNDASIVNSLDTNDDGTPDWEVGYRARVDDMMNLLTGPSGQRSVIWIGAPTMRDSSRDKAVVQLNQVMQEEAAKRAPHVTYFDAYKLFSDEDGEYSDRLDTPDGNVRVRIGDGVHLTPAGAQLLATPIAALLDAHWHITAHADPSQPIGVTVAEGGELYGGSGNGSGSSGNSNSNSRKKSSSGTSNRKSTPTTKPQTEATAPEAEAPEPDPPDPNPPAEPNPPSDPNPDERPPPADGSDG